MKLRTALLASAALLGAAALASPALAIEQIHIPDASAAPSSGPPDALFDKSVPTTWQKKSDDDQNAGSSLGQFHFSANSGYGPNTQSSSTPGMDPHVPGSEFRQNGQPLYQDPYAPR